MGIALIFLACFCLLPFFWQGRSKSADVEPGVGLGTAFVVCIFVMTGPIGWLCLAGWWFVCSSERDS